MKSFLSTIGGALLVLALVLIGALIINAYSKTTYALAYGEFFNIPTCTGLRVKTVEEEGIQIVQLRQGNEVVYATTMPLADLEWTIQSTSPPFIISRKGWLYSLKAIDE